MDRNLQNTHMDALLITLPRPTTLVLSYLVFVILIVVILVMVTGGQWVIKDCRIHLDRQTGVTTAQPVRQIIDILASNTFYNGNMTVKPIIVASICFLLYFWSVTAEIVSWIVGYKPNVISLYTFLVSFLLIYLHIVSGCGAARTGLSANILVCAPW